MISATDALVAGNYCHDTLVRQDGSYEVLGGSSSYISAVFRGLEVRHQVVAKAGPDFRYEAQVRHAPRIVPGTRTTHFVDDFTSGVRQSILKSEAAAITPEDLGTIRARLGIACGVAREILPETLVRLKALCPIVIADIQGLIRATDAEGHVVNRMLAETAFMPVISQIDFLKVGEDELAFVGDAVSISRQTALLVTYGRGGSRLIRAGQEFHAPASLAREVDSSGAGDSFMAGFAYALLQGMEMEDALRWGNRFGALAVSQIGIPDFKAASLTYRYAMCTPRIHYGKRTEFSDP
jgi:1D-myo-inositol 3-kinase